MCDAYEVMEKEIFTRGGLPDEAKEMRAPIGAARQDTVVCYGRVCCEAAEGKINKMSVLLEGGRRDGGRRMKLILNETPSYALFPGQYVAVEGIERTSNPGHGAASASQRNPPQHLHFHVFAMTFHTGACTCSFCSRGCVHTLQG